MTDFRYGAYPRSQRIAWLVLLAVATAVTAGVNLLPQSELLPGAARAALLIRQGEAAEAAANFRPAPESFAFDPNTVSAEDLQRLGLSQRQASSWLKFRGKRTNAFRRPEDINKLFVLSDEEKARLLPLAYVAEGSAEDKHPYQKRGKADWASFAYDPNTVSAGELRQLGLSEKQARAFVRYRESARYGRMFRKAEDILRLKTLSDQQKDHLVAHAEIPPEVESEPLPQQRFSFDPNTISEDSLVLLGFPRWQAKSFGKYRGDRTTSFRRPADLRRVGALDSALVEDVLPFVDIAPFTSPAPQQYSAPAAPPALASFDVNSGNLSAWKRLPGVGDYRAKRIVAHRNKYGGFYSLDQLAATPDLPDSTFQQILPYLTVGPVFRQIAVNHATVDELKSHPNISRSLANVIVKNREKNGRFAGVEDLRRIRVITKKNLPTLLPYLSFE